ncbi:MAG: DnaB-like helicase N-terminal domain-containing protein [Streptosporangiaceae bacterium]|jgi:replicative DNA helicase
MPNLAVRAEQAVLGALLTDPTLVDQVPYLAGSDFSDATHKWIFDAIAETRAAHPEATDQRLMVLVAASTPEIDVAYLTSLPDRCPVPAHLAAYGRMVAEAAMIRELDVHAHRIARGAADLIRRRASVATSGPRSRGAAPMEAVPGVVTDVTASTRLRVIGGSAQPREIHSCVLPCSARCWSAL